MLENSVVARRVGVSVNGNPVVVFGLRSIVTV
jgi:hypothetical protein